MKMRVKELVSFIRERHSIYLRKQKGYEKPWTKDPILQQYRFCNVYRELDTVTQWIAKYWRRPNEQDPNVWFAMVVARLVNWPDSLAEIGYPVPWFPATFMRVMNQRQKDGQKIFTGAYMIHADATARGTKADYLAQKVLNPLWKARNVISPYAPEDSLQAFHQRLMKHRDMGSFMAGQVVADTKYTDGLRDVPDWWTWAAIGPGSARGLSRVLDLPVMTKWKQEPWLAQVQQLRTAVNRSIRNDMNELCAQDLQNVLCEFDKYSRVRLGEGRPRSLYDGTAIPQGKYRVDMELNFK